MAVETTFDNEGIKKGLQQITLQLNETNKQLAEQGKPNLYKAFKENQAEVFTSIATSAREMAQEREIFAKTPSGTGVVKDPKLGDKGKDISKDDTLYGQMANLVSIQTKALEEANIEKQEQKKIEEEKKRLEREELEKEDKANEEELLRLDKLDTQGVINNKEQVKRTELQTRQLEIEEELKTEESEAKKKEEEDKAKELEDAKSFRFQFSKRLFGENGFAGFKKSFNLSIITLGGTFGKKIGGLVASIGTGFTNLGKKFLGGLKKFFGGIGFALKTIGAILLIGGLYKFLSSETWQKMKPNIAESIGNGLEMMDFAVRTLYGIITDYVIPMFKSLVNGLFSALDTLGLVRKDQRTYDAEDYDKKTAQMESGVARMSEEGYDEQGTFEPDFMYNTRMKGKKMAIERLAKRKANREENLQAIHENRKEKYVRQYMSFYSGSTRAEALAEYQEQHEGHILGMGPSTIGMIQDYTNPAYTGGGNSTIVTDASTVDARKISYNSGFTQIQHDTFTANLARLNGL